MDRIFGVNNLPPAVRVGGSSAFFPRIAHSPMFEIPRLFDLVFRMSFAPSKDNSTDDCIVKPRIVKLASVKPAIGQIHT